MGLQPEHKRTGALPDRLPGRVVEKLQALLGPKFVLTDPGDLLVYETDAMTVHKLLPPAVLIPGSGEEVAAAVKVLAEEHIPFAPRGAGTGLAGGALSLSGAVIFEMAR